MAYKLNAGIEVSINGTTWYKLTDHNRQEITITPTLIEKEQRMANGTLRKFVVSKKDTISTSWDFIPTLGKQNTFAITSAVVSSNTIIYATGTNHNFATGSEIKVSGFTNKKLNVVAVITGKTANSFTVSNVKGASNGTTTAPASVTEIVSPITTVDGNYGAAWLTAFYNANVGNPIYVKIISSKYTDPSIGTVPNDSTYVSALTGSTTYQVFITSFNKTIRKRTTSTDYVDMSIEFTEI